MEHGLIWGEACNRRLRDADEHALFKWRAAVGQGGSLISRPTLNSEDKFHSKLARSAQSLIVLHDSCENQFDVNHKFDVSLLLECMVRTQLGQAITTTGRVTLAGSIISNTVMHGMVGSHSTRVNVIKRSVGLVPGDLKGIRPTSN